MEIPFVSICIITGGNLPRLNACLASIKAQKGAPAFEVIVCANGAPDVSGPVRFHFPSAIVGRAERSPLGAARNPLVQRARGEWLLFLDDDVTIGEKFLSQLRELSAEHPEASVLGGPNDTPPRRPRFEIVQGAVLSSIVVSGPVRRRYGPHPAGPADERFFTLCNLAVRRDAMLSFPPELVGAEENAVLVEMHRQGLAMHYDPEFAAFHERRSGMRSFAAQMFKYGLGRGQLTRQSPSTLRAAYAAPAALILYAILAAGAMWLQPLVLAPLTLYAAGIGATALRIDWDLRKSYPGHLANLSLAGAQALVVHLFYGLGFLRGILIFRREGSEFAPVWSEGGALPTDIPELELTANAKA